MLVALELAMAETPERTAARPAHRERNQRLAAEGKLLAGGPWADDSGALVLFVVDSVAEAKVLIAEDPYYTTPGVEVTSLHEWNAAIRADVIADL